MSPRTERILLILVGLAVIVIPLGHAPTVSATPCPVTICWTNASGGSWDTGSNWNLGRVPTSTDDVAITTPAVVVTVSSVVTVNSLYVGFGPTVDCAASCTLTILTHTPGWSYDIASGDLLDIYGNVVNHAQFVNKGLIHIESGGTFVNHNKLDFSSGTLTNNGVFDEKCGASVVGTVSGTVVPETQCPSSVGTGSFASELGSFTSLTSTPIGSVTPAPPAGLTFPDGLFSFTLSGLRVGQIVVVVITLVSPLPAGPFSYWKLHGGSWVQLPSSQASLDSTRTVITLTLTDGATPDDADGSANGVIVDPGGPAVPAAPIPEYSLGVPLVIVFMIFTYGLIARRTRIKKRTLPF